MSEDIAVNSPATVERDPWGSLFRAVFWIVLSAVLILSSMPNPPTMPPNTDKMQHAAAFFTLVLLGGLAYPRISLLKLVIGLAAFGALIEFVQAIPVLHRQTELLDWVADVGGIAAAIVVLGAWRAIRR
jgi:hypothetical protein